MINKNLIRYWLPLMVYGLLILIQSTRPLMFPGLRHLDKPIHFVAYALLGILMFRALYSLPGKCGTALIALMAVFVSSMVGCGDEIIQIFVPSRTIDRADFLYDVLGSVSGVLLYLVLIKVIRPRPKPADSETSDTP